MTARNGSRPAIPREMSNRGVRAGWSPAHVSIIMAAAHQPSKSKCTIFQGPLQPGAVSVAVVTPVTSPRDRPLQPRRRRRSGGGGGGCFIATGAYESLFEPQVKILRQSRDEYPLPSELGTAFIDLYYRYSPPIAHVIAKHKSLRWAVRITLMPLMGISYVALHITPIQKLLFLMLMLYLTANIFILIRRKKRFSV